MKRFFLLICLFVNSYVFSQPLPSTENIQEFEFRQAFDLHIKGLLLYRDFKELERLFNKYQDVNLTTPSGIPLLSKYADGITYKLGKLSKTDKEKKYWANRDKRYFDWLKAYPKSQAAHFYRLNDFINRAWTYRGDGALSDVSEKRQKNYYQYVILAIKLLEEKKELLSSTPEYYTAYIEVIKALPDREDKFNQLIEEGIAKFPSYSPLYYTAVLNLLPKWGGSFAKIEKFAVDALATFDGYGKSIYAQIYWNADFKEKALTGGEVNLDLWEVSVRDFIYQYPDQWNINHFAANACHLQRDSLLVDLVDKFEYPVLNTFWSDDHLYWSCMQKVKALNQEVYLKTQTIPEVNAKGFEDAFRRYIKGLLYDDEFAELDSLFEKYNENKAMTSSGYWLVVAMIDALKFYADYEIDKSKEDWSFRDNIYQKWQAKAPESNLLIISRAYDFIHRAWSYRGQGLANTVRDEDWEPIYFYIQQAVNLVDKNKDELKKYPGYYALQLRLMRLIYSEDETDLNRYLDTLIKGVPISFSNKLSIMTFLDGDKKTTENMYQEAFLTFPDYSDIFYAAADDYFPKWGGSYREFERFARHSMKVSSEEGASMYARMYLKFYEGYSGSGKKLVESELDKDLWKQGVKDFIAQHPNQYWLNKFTEASCHLMGKGVEDTFVSDLFKQIELPVNTYVWKNYFYYWECREHAMHLGTPLK